MFPSRPDVPNPLLARRAADTPTKWAARAALVGLAALGLLALPAVAQDAPSTEGLFTDEVDVRVVNLEVVVTQKGERVTGLASDDFTLLVDGVETPIEFFTEIHGGRAVDRAPSSDVVPGHQPGAAVGTRYLVFVDDVFTLPSRRNRVLRRLSRDLERLQPEDSMAVVAFDGRSIELLSSWSDSPRQLAGAFRQAQDRPALGLRQRSQQRFDEDLWLANAGPLERRLGLFGYTGSVRRGSQSFSDLEAVVDAASASLRAFARPDGRKVLILVSGNWPPSFETWGSPSDSYAAYGPSRPDSYLFSPLIDTANRLGYTLYPVDSPGIQHNFADASYGGFYTAERIRRDAENREWYQEGALVALARETGGRALLDGAASNVLEKVAEDTRSYYSIGFTPDWQANDRRHQVKLEVRGKNKVRVRRSFSDLSRETETTLRLESAQLFDLPVPGAERIRVATGEPENGGWKKVIVPLLVEIPLDQVTHLPSASGYATRLELRVAVIDDRGDRADIPVIPIVLERETEPGEGETRVFATKLKMRERDHRLVVSLYDPASGTELSERLDVRFDDI